jgi:hypothetical protein
MAGLESRAGRLTGHAAGHALDVIGEEDRIDKFFPEKRGFVGSPPSTHHPCEKPGTDGMFLDCFFTLTKAN